MFDISNNIIRITKGDTASINVDLQNADGTEYTMQSGDTLTLTVRKKARDPVLLQVTSSTNELSLPSSQTKMLEVGSCCYDIELKTASGGIYTVVGLTDRQEVNMVVYPEITETE